MLFYLYVPSVIYKQFPLEDHYVNNYCIILDNKHNKKAIMVSSLTSSKKRSSHHVDPKCFYCKKSIGTGKHELSRHLLEKHGIEESNPIAKRYINMRYQTVNYDKKDKNYKIKVLRRKMILTKHQRELIKLIKDIENSLKKREIKESNV